MWFKYLIWKPGENISSYSSISIRFKYTVGKPRDTFSSYSSEKVVGKSKLENILQVNISIFYRFFSIGNNLFLFESFEDDFPLLLVIYSKTQFGNFLQFCKRVWKFSLVTKVQLRSFFFRKGCKLFLNCFWKSKEQTKQIF